MSSFVYRVIGLMGLTLPPGAAVKLTDAQLKARAHQVKPVDGLEGFHASERDHLQFKRGELVELAAELPKGQVANGIVDPLDAAGQPLPLPPASKPTPGPAFAKIPRRAAKAGK